MQRFSLTVEWFRYCATFSSQAYELLEETLFDPSEKVAKTSREVFLPSFAAWAQDLDKVESHLFTSLISIVENALKVRCLFKCLDTILDLNWTGSTYNSVAMLCKLGLSEHFNWATSLNSLIGLYLVGFGAGSRTCQWVRGYWEST